MNWDSANQLLEDAADHVGAYARLEVDRRRFDGCAPGVDEGVHRSLRPGVADHAIPGVEEGWGHRELHNAEPDDAN